MRKGVVSAWAYWNGYKAGDWILYENRYIGQIKHIDRYELRIKWEMGRGTIPPVIFEIKGSTWKSLNPCAIKRVTEADRCIFRMEV